ncbi:MAG: hypothetical protein ACRCZH_04260, partial [Cetobacterium sp.]
LSYPFKYLTVIEVTKNNFTEGFINGFGASTPTYITVQQIDSSGNNIGASVSAGRGANSTTGIEFNMTDVKISFLNTGLLRFNMKTLDNTKSYRYKITHRNSNSSTGIVMMEHILNIQSRRKLMERTASLNDIVIEDVEGLNLETIYDFGTLGMEQIGNGSDLIDKTNPFPALALGAQGTVSSSTGWSYSSNSTNTQSRDPITTAYKSTLATSITMQMYFANTTGIITNLEGGAVTILKKGNPETVVGAFGDAKREKMLTNLKGKITGDLNSLLTQFRASTAKEIIFESESKANEQISYVVAQKNDDKNYYVPSKSDLNSTLVSDAKIEYRNYPKLLLRKTQLNEASVLTLSDSFNLANSIPFSSTGVNVSGAFLSSSGARYFKSSHFESTFTIGNDTTKRPIDISGNSSLVEVTLYDGTKELKLSFQYKDRYPVLKILNTPSAGKYSLNTKHYEASGLERLNYNLEIVIEKDFVLPEPGMVRTNSLNEFVIEDDIESEKYKIVSGNLGTLAMQQTKTVISGNIFPFIALGKKNNPNGWSFILDSPGKDRGADVTINYTNDLYSTYPLNLKMSLEEKTSSTGATKIKVGYNNLLSGFGAFKSNENEEVSVLLKGNLQSTSEGNLSALLTDFRKRSEREIFLTPQGDVTDQISYVIADYTSGKYNVPTT